jgi:hypothetical protein
MFKWLRKLFPEKEKCTTCGLPFSRLEWGGRCHYSQNGCSWWIHPIDYIVTMKAKTFAEKRQKMEEFEEIDKLAWEWKKKSNVRT